MQLVVRPQHKGTSKFTFHPFSKHTIYKTFITTTQCFHISFCTNYISTTLIQPLFQPKTNTLLSLQLTAPQSQSLIMVIKLYYNINHSYFRMTDAPKSSMKHYKRIRDQEVSTVVKNCGAVGRGLFAEVDIKLDQYIVEYVGDVIDQNEYLRRSAHYKGLSYRHDYFASLNKNWMLDATMVGNSGRFANHSCNPNSGLFRERLNGSNIEILYIGAIRNITKGEEITISYDWFKSDTGIINLNECQCHSKNCKGYI